MRVDVVDESALAVASLPDKGVVVWTDPEDADPRRLDLVDALRGGGGAVLVFLGADPRGAWRGQAFLGFSVSTGSPRGKKQTASGSCLFRRRPPRLRTVQRGRALASLPRPYHPVRRRRRASRPIRCSSISRTTAPAVWECRRGRGRVLVVAASPDLAAREPPPLSHVSPLRPRVRVRIWRAPGRSDPRHENLVGSDLVFDLAPRWSVQTGALRVRTESGGEASPGVRRNRGRARRRRSSPIRGEVGFYTLVADTTRVMEACVNVDTRESNLNPRAARQENARRRGSCRSGRGSRERDPPRDGRGARSTRSFCSSPSRRSPRRRSSAARRDDASLGRRRQRALLRAARESRPRPESSR